MNSEPLAVVFDASDVDQFLRDRPPCREVLALTPECRAALEAAGIDSRTTALRYSHIGHLRSVVRLRRTLRDLDASLSSSDRLGLAAKESFRLSAGRVVASGSRIWETLGTEPDWLVHHEGAWQTSSTRGEAYRLLAARILRRRVGAIGDRMPLFPELYRRLSRLQSHLLRGRHPVVIDDPRGWIPELQLKINDASRATSTLLLRFTNGGIADYLLLFRAMLKTLVTPENGRLVVAPAAARNVDGDIRSIVGGVSDPVSKMALAAAIDDLAADVQATTSLAEAFLRKFHVIRPYAVLSDGFGAGRHAALGQAAKDAGADCYILGCQGSNTVPKSATGRWMMTEIARGRLVSPFASTCYADTPHAAELADAARVSERSTKVSPVRAGRIARPSRGREAQPFVILHASNFTNWNDHLPFVIDTSDEYVAGLERLVNAVSANFDLRLIIRAKGKRECDTDVLRRLLPSNTNVSFSSGMSFEQDLARAQLVVGNMTRTLEQALMSRIPILLLTGLGLYQHFAPRTSPPTRADRAAVYAEPANGRLAELVRAIGAAHEYEALTDDELRGLVWPEDAPGLEAVAADIVGAEQRSAIPDQRRSTPA